MKRSKFDPLGAGVSGAAVSMVLLMGGCGSGAHNTSSGTGSPTKTSATTAGTARSSQPSSSVRSSFVQRADAICVRVNAELAAARPAGSSVSDTVKVVSLHATIEHEGLNRLEALTPPVALTRDWKLVLHYRRTLADELTLLLNDTSRGHTAAISALGASKARAHHTLLSVATRAHLQVCGNVG